MSELFRTDYKDVDGIMKSFKTNEIYVWCAVNKSTGEVELEDVRQFDDELDRLNGDWKWQKFYLNTRPNDAKWISVEDELPEKGKTVLITDGVLTYVAVLNRMNGYDFQIADDWEGVEFSHNAINLEDVTHWMPLPTPPKQSSEGE